jgi:integrase
VRIIHATLRAMLNAAVDDDEITFSNPAAGKLGSALRLVEPAAARQEQIKAMRRDQLQEFLDTAAQHDRRHYGLFLLLARTGMRLGEALALQ